MKNYTNFIFAMILFVAAVSGCKYSYGSADGGKKEKNPAAKKTLNQTGETRKSESERFEDEEKDSGDDETIRATGSGDTDSLTGTWVWARTGSSTVSDSGDYLGGSGSRFTYEFSEGGAVKYTGAMSVMNGSCRMLVTAVSEGQATLDGDRLNIEWQPGTSTREDSCSSSQNYTKETPAETQNLTIRFQEKSGRRQLCLIEKDENCFSRVE